LDFRLVCLFAEFSQEAEKEQLAVYAAVDFPVGQSDLGIFEGFAPGQRVFVDAVDQRAIKIEKERWD